MVALGLRKKGGANAPPPRFGVELVPTSARRTVNRFPIGNGQREEGVIAPPLQISLLGFIAIRGLFDSRDRYPYFCGGSQGEPAVASWPEDGRG